MTQKIVHPQPLLILSKQEAKPQLQHLKSSILAPTISSTCIWPHVICIVEWKVLWCDEPLCAYKATTSYKWGFKWLHRLFFKKEIELKKHSLSIEPRTWIMAIFATLKYFKKECDKSCDAWITHHKQCDGINNIILALYLFEHHLCFKGMTSMCKTYKPMKKWFFHAFHDQIVGWEICRYF
jgi:hypothetical protein